MSQMEALKACPLFRDFTDTGLLVISKLIRERNIQAGTPIFVENMVAESLFLVKSGVVGLSVQSNDGRQVTLQKLVPGDTFGELSLLIGGQRMVTATAKTDCGLLEIPRQDFARLQKQKPQACLKLMINIVRHFGDKLSAAREHIKPLILSQLDEA
jgi:CRP-like cAMP-binding protein